MSGDDLRDCCKFNRYEELKEFLECRANPCSSDEYGLTPLHYAIWNGHLECIKYLIMNPQGITRNRERIPCINLKSCMGYTPLHLLALEGPVHIMKDALWCLLLNGGDLKEIDHENKNPYQIAKENHNQAFIDAFQEFIQIQKSNKELLTNYLKNLKEKYVVVKKKKFVVAREGGEEGRVWRLGEGGGEEASIGDDSSFDGSTIDTRSYLSNDSGGGGSVGGTKGGSRGGSRVGGSQGVNNNKKSGSQGGKRKDNDDKKLKLPSTNASATSSSPSPSKKGIRKDPIQQLPDEMQQVIGMASNTIKIEKPEELIIHEDLIPSLTRFSFVHLNGIESLKGLSFVKNEALKNIARREKLVQQSVSLPSINLKNL